MQTAKTLKNNFESKGSLTHGRKLINVVDKPIMIHAAKMNGSYKHNKLISSSTLMDYLETFLNSFWIKVIKKKLTSLCPLK